jgi:predicted dienelactone hydrolase
VTPLLLVLLACDVPTDDVAVDSDPVVPRVPADLGVGVTERTLTDPTRGTPENGSAPATSSRVLPTRIWYPSTLPPEQGEVGDAPLDATLPWPLVIFVHGSTATPLAYAWAGDALARAGYVVAAADMPLTSLVTPGGSTDRHVEDQPADVRFLADTLLSGAVDLFPSGTLRTDGYAVAGHSTGGTVALLAAFAPDAHDDRLLAAVDWSGDACFFGDGFFGTRPVPLLAVGGTDDLYVPPAISVVRTYELAQAPKVLAVLRGGTHLGFTSVPLPDDPGVTPTRPGDALADTLAAYGGGTDCDAPPRSDDAPLALDVQHARVGAWTVAFLDAHVRGDRAALAALLEAAEGVDARAEGEPTDP